MSSFNYENAKNLETNFNTISNTKTETMKSDLPIVNFPKQMTTNSNDLSKLNRSISSKKSKSFIESHSDSINKINGRGNNDSFIKRATYTENILFEEMNMAENNFSSKELNLSNLFKNKNVVHNFKKIHSDNLFVFQNMQKNPEKEKSLQEIIKLNNGFIEEEEKEEKEINKSQKKDLLTSVDNKLKNIKKTFEKR